MKRFSPALLVASLSLVTQAPFASGGYRDDVLADKPVIVWNLNEISNGQVSSAGSFSAPAAVHGKLSLISGPRPSPYPAFEKTNKAAAIRSGAWLRVTDPGDKSPLDFDLGDTITLEAWVSMDEIKDGQQIYIVGKGRTKAAGTNQNYALRLRGVNGAGCVSFLFRDSRNRPGVGDPDWHRWTTKSGVAPQSGWHHVAVTYTFGKPDSIRGYIDGVELHGSWDMGGPTELGPVVDNDELWIGTSMGGSPNSTFNGAIDEIAIYRGSLSPERIASRFVHTGEVAPAISIADLPKDQIRVEILERLQKPATEDLLAEANAGGNDVATMGAPVDPIDASWSSPPDVPTETYLENAFGFALIPSKYSERGIKIDRSSPFMIRASGAITLPPGEHRLLVRALSGARLAVDGRVVATTKFITRRYSDNEEVPDQAALMLVSGVRMLPAGHSEALATIRGYGKPHVITLEALVGGKNLRPETGELSVSISTDGGPFRLLTPQDEQTSLSNDGWTTYRSKQRERIVQIEAARRRNQKEDAYWAQRHELARKVVSQKPAPAVPENAADLPAFNEVDRFINARLNQAGVTPAPLTDDYAFLRRLTLDLAGVVPTPDEIQQFLATAPSERRAKAIDRLLSDSRWADAWVPYWQDALAENPAILKATLNNTGPFRFWIYESFLDNKPMDRFVTELISMDGSVHYGGPAGFGVASQNDVPMAAKAQILTSTFLGAEMKCARCHDAPSHPFDQKDLFGIAAMLQRGTIKVPVTSSVPGLSPNSHVTVTLKTGTAVDPHWPLTEFPEEPLPGVQRNPNDPRERLAAILTDPRNDRFAQVLVNRVWKRLLGWGLVEPVDDWDVAIPSHPELLRWLSHQFVSHGYDIKHVTRLIVNSHAYQRIATIEGSKAQKPGNRLFQAPARRRMTAEQIVDSLFVAAGKEFETEELNFDTDARRSIKDFNNFGRPRRAWEFTPLSNERDRPALALPRAQTILDVLSAYGWRESRAEPKSTRDHDPNVLQPASLANGIMGARITRLSDESAFTQLATQELTAEKLVEQLFIRVLSRKPFPEESAVFVEALTPGFTGRRIAVDPNTPPRRANPARAVSWSNHLHADATKVKLELEKEARAGDPPTSRLTTPWRERMEDAVWALMLTPEFVFTP